MHRKRTTSIELASLAGLSSATVSLLLHLMFRFSFSSSNATIFLTRSTPTRPTSMQNGLDQGRQFANGAGNRKCVSTVPGRHHPTKFIGRSGR